MWNKMLNRAHHDDDSTLSPQRFTPQFPAHPGLKQDDGAKRVSWLRVAARVSFPRPFGLSGSTTLARR
jgi:hypothetical protein